METHMPMHTTTPTTRQLSEHQQNRSLSIHEGANHIRTYMLAQKHLRTLIYYGQVPTRIAPRRVALGLPQAPANPPRSYGDCWPAVRKRAPIHSHLPRVHPLARFRSADFDQYLVLPRGCSTRYHRHFGCLRKRSPKPKSWQLRSRDGCSC